MPVIRRGIEDIDSEKYCTNISQCSENNTRQHDNGLIDDEIDLDNDNSNGAPRANL